MTTNYHIRLMHKDEIQLAIQWAEAEGWNPGLNDAESFYQADPNGFLLGLIDNQPIATISAVRYGEQAGFVGFYIVKPEFRGQGYGLQIWNEAMHSLEGRNVGLDGVLDQQQNYMKSGFSIAYNNRRYEGVGDGSKVDTTDFVPLQAIDFDKICQYDQKLFGSRRDTFLKGWVNQPDAYSIGLIEEGELTAMGILRPCSNGYKIGPLYARTPIQAEKIFLALKAKVGQGEAFYLDTPEVNQDAVNLACRHNMEPVFETARMYTRGQPEVNMQQLYGVTSFELG